MSDYVPKKPKSIGEVITSFARLNAQQDVDLGYISEDEQDGYQDVYVELVGDFLDEHIAAAERRGAVRALRESARGLNESTEADICNKAGVPRPLETVSDFLTVVYWLKARADEWEAGE